MGLIPSYAWSAFLSFMTVKPNGEFISTQIYRYIAYLKIRSNFSVVLKRFYCGVCRALFTQDRSFRTINFVCFCSLWSGIVYLYTFFGISWFSLMGHMRSSFRLNCNLQSKDLNGNKNDLPSIKFLGWSITQQRVFEMAGKFFSKKCSLSQAHPRGA